MVIKNNKYHQYHQYISNIIEMCIYIYIYNFYRIYYIPVNRLKERVCFEL